MIRTDNLILKDYNEKYVDEMHYNVLSSKETAKYMLWKPSDTILEAKEKLEKWSSIFKFCYIICTQSDEPIGFVSFNEIEDNVYGDLGIAIGERYVNKGYGSEILSTIIGYIKSINGKQIHYSHIKENEQSLKLALKFGFKFYKSSNITRRYDNKEFEELFYVLNL